MDSETDEQPSTSAAPQEPDDDTTKLTDLNDDFLMEIFEHLNLVDLISVSTTNKRLNENALLVFSHKFSRYRIEVSGTCVSAWDGDRNITCKQHYIHRPDVQAFLYYFGDSITRLSIQFDDRLTPKQIERNLLKCCSKGLVELKLSKIRQCNTFNVNRWGMFPRVTRLSLCSCDMPPNIFDAIFARFPSVTHLELVNSHDYRLTTPVRSSLPKIRKHFAHLQHFKYFANSYWFNNDVIISLIETHPSIRSLALGVTFYLRGAQIIDIGRIINHLRRSIPNLEALELWNLNEELDLTERFPVHLKKLIVSGPLQRPIELPSSSVQLEDLEIGMRGLAFSRNHRLDISRFKAIKRLSIQLSGRRNEGWGLIDDTVFLRLANLDKLEELTLKQTGQSISVDVAKRFISNCESLRRLNLVFYTKNKEKRDQFCGMDFGPLWRVYDEFLAVVIERIK